MKKFLLILTCITFAITGIAKEDVSGVVKDASGQPVKGVRLRINGLFKTTKTKGGGIFKLKNVMEGDSLIVYVTEKKMAIFPILPNSVLDIQLQSDCLVCKTGSSESQYLYQSVPDVTYSNNIITARQIREISARNLIDLLRGRVPGLEIQDANGVAKANIRGSISMNLDTEPLFVVGTTQYESLESANNSVSMEDIKEIEVKKDGSEYGMKGANGVIIIRMK